MGAEQEQNELTDVTLCYQAMGIPLSASPTLIEQRYKALAAEYKRKMASEDAAVREEAKASLELLTEMHQKICGSITYKAMEKEYTKNQPVQPPTKKVHDAIAQRGLMINCPRCNGLMVKGTEICPICKTPVYTGIRKLLKGLFSR